MTLRRTATVLSTLGLLAACGSGAGDTGPTTSGAVSSTLAPTTVMATTTVAATSTTVAATTTVAAPTTIAPTSTAPTTTTVPDGPFRLVAQLETEAITQWIDGPEIGLVAFGDTAYVAVESDAQPEVQVAAISLSAGTITWVSTVAEVGGFGYALGATSRGVLVPYLVPSADGGDDDELLTLLDADTGRPLWTVPVGVYDIYGEAAEGFGRVDLSESEGALVDLDDGAVLPLDDTMLEWRSLDGVLVAVDGRTLRIGYDPFDGSSDQDLTLPFAIDDVYAIGDVLVVGAGGDVVGVVAGEEVWRVSEAERFVDPLGPGLLTVRKHVDDGWGEYQLVEILSYDASGVEPLAGLPEGFVPYSSESVGQIVAGTAGGTTTAIDGTPVALLVHPDGLEALGPFDGGPNNQEALDCTSGCQYPPYHEPPFVFRSNLIIPTEEGFVVHSVSDFDRPVGVPAGSSKPASDYSVATTDTYFVVIDVEAGALFVYQ